MQLAVHPAVTTVTRVWYENAVQSGFVIYDTTNVQHSDAEERHYFAHGGANTS